MRRAALILAGVLAAASSCRMDRMITDTGYRGTWRRANDRNESIVAITDAGGRWRFRWIKRSFDHKFRVDCDWMGHCEERLNGAVIATYTIVTRYDEGKLYTDTVEERVSPVKVTARYTDVMEVRDGGRTLWNFTTDRDGQHFDGDERPNRTFDKIADGVADPPRSAAVAG
jgi:hypothetical protein